MPCPDIYPFIFYDDTYSSNINMLDSDINENMEIDSGTEAEQ